jgi:phosphoglycolate phosphatase
MLGRKEVRMGYEGVVFDLDGTLVDTLQDIAGAMNAVLAELGHPRHGEDEYRLLIGHGLRDLVTRSLPPGARAAEEVAGGLERLLAVYGERCLDRTRPYAQVPELLDELRARGLRLAVLSNKADELTARIVAALFAPGVFDAVLGARPGLPLKPDPASALLVARLLEAPPAALAYVGDSGVDMRTATAAGMLPVGVAWGLREPAELLAAGAAIVLQQPLELLAVLEQPLVR